MKQDTRSWKCLFGMHQYDILLAEGPCNYQSEFVSKNGHYYVCKCSHCGKVKQYTIY